MDLGQVLYSMNLGLICFSILIAVIKFIVSFFNSKSPIKAMFAVFATIIFLIQILFVPTPIFGFMLIIHQSISLLITTIAIIFLYESFELTHENKLLYYFSILGTGILYYVVKNIFYMIRSGVSLEADLSNPLTVSVVILVVLGIVYIILKSKIWGNIDKEEKEDLNLNNSIVNFFFYGENIILVPLVLYFTFSDIFGRGVSEKDFIIVIKDREDMPAKFGLLIGMILSFGWISLQGLFGLDAIQDSLINSNPFSFWIFYGLGIVVLTMFLIVPDNHKSTFICAIVIHVTLFGSVLWVLIQLNSFFGYILFENIIYNFFYSILDSYSEDGLIAFYFIFKRHLLETGIVADFLAKLIFRIGLVLFYGENMVKIAKNY